VYNQEYDIYQFVSKLEQMKILFDSLIYRFAEKIVWSAIRLSLVFKEKNAIEVNDKFIAKIENYTGHRFTRRPVIINVKGKSNFNSRATGKNKIILYGKSSREEILHELIHINQMQNSPRAYGCTRSFQEGYAEFFSRDKNLISDIPNNPYDTGYEMFKRIEQAFGRKIINKIAMKHSPSYRELKCMYEDACKKIGIMPLWGL